MFTRVLLLLLTGSLLATSIAIGQREVSALTYLGANDSAFFDLALADDIHPTTSYSATNGLLQRCVNVVGGIYAALQPEERATRARENCLNRTDASLEDMPTHALGWYAKSLLSYKLGRPEAGEAALINAQVTGRHEQWLAEGRVQLAEDNLATLSPTAFEGHIKDLELLVQSRRGVASVAQRYATQPQFRERITSVAETLSAEDQLRFLNNVRSATRQFGLATP